MDKSLYEQLFVTGELDQSYILTNRYIDGAGTGTACPVMRQSPGRFSGMFKGCLLSIEIHRPVG